MRLPLSIITVSAVLALTACGAAPTKEAAATKGKPTVAKAMKKDANKKAKKPEDKKKPKVAAALTDGKKKPAPKKGAKDTKKK